MIVAPGEKVPFTLVQVAIFLAVARTGGPTLAAQVLDISQPAVSKTLSGLEQVSLHINVLIINSFQCLTHVG